MSREKNEVIEIAVTCLLLSSSCLVEWLEQSFFTGTKMKYRINLKNFLTSISLKGLSHEIDFKNVVENGQILALIRAAAGFFGGCSDF